MSDLVLKTGDIILNENGTYHIIFGKCISFANENDENNNMYVVKAVFLYKGKYYKIPSSVSFAGTFDITRRKFTIVEHDIDIIKLEDLPIKICKKICPGYLD